MRFKNFSKELIVVKLSPKEWVYQKMPELGSIVMAEFKLVEPGQVTNEFDPDDPNVQLMLKAHPELRPIVVPSVWERLRQPAL
jgi:hypothetical protein